MSTQSDWPWSAAFIVWAVKQAGIPFPTISAHTAYAQEIRKNPRKYPFQIINPSTSSHKPGDIIIFNRVNPETKRLTTMTFNTDPWTGPSHGDVVVGPNLGIGGNLSIGKSSGRVLLNIFTSTDLNQAFVILRPSRPGDADKLAKIVKGELALWNRKEWNDENQEGARQQVNLYWKATGQDLIPPPDGGSELIYSTKNEENTYGGISPYISSLESFHPNIQYELTRRRIGANTADVYMPFVKLTSLVNVLGDNIPNAKKGTEAARCPSLGPHGKTAHTFGETYLNLSLPGRSRIGYAWSNGDTPELVDVIVDESATTTDPQNIPMPGITEIIAERGTSGPMGIRGGLTKAEVKIAAYSVGQVDALLRYFLRPATRVVLEWGRKSATQYEIMQPFNWKQNVDDIRKTFTDIIKSPDSGSAFINKYIYNNNGNYEILPGYVVKFNLAVNKNNVYEISLTIHSIQQFEIPNKHTGVKSLCSDATSKCSAMDIHEYFDDSYSWKEKTFNKLMTKEEALIKSAKESKTFYQWNGHVINHRNETPDIATTQANSGASGTKGNDYFVSWQFFVDKILNDKELGILGLIDNRETQEFIQTAILRPTKDKIEVRTSGSDDTTYNALVANHVGYHADLRSTNPEVMIIYNQDAQNRRSPEDRAEYKLVVEAVSTEDENLQKSLTTDNRIEANITESKVGSFRNIEDDGMSGVGSLLHGVWLNTKAIKQAFMNTDTVSSAIESLLMMINAATEGYWNLQLYSSERSTSGMFVIDYGLSKPLAKTTDGNSKFPWIDEEENQTNDILDGINKINIDRYRKSRTDEAGKNQPKYIYMFNRKTKVLSDGTGELGSDIIDLKVEFNLPQVVAVQAIAGVGGPAQKSTLQTLDIPQLNKISLINNIFPPCLTDKDPDPAKDKNFTCPDISPCQDENQKTLEDRVKELENKNIPLLRSLPTPPQVRKTSQLRDMFDIAIAADPLQKSEQIRRDREYTERLNQLNEVKFERSGINPEKLDTVRQLSNLGTSLNLVELNVAKMMKKLNINSRSIENGYGVSKVHAFNSSNLTKTIASVTLPGIGGIELFQSFLIDRVPSILKLGFYVVTKVTHKFSSDSGWVTTIDGRFRYRPDDTGLETSMPDCFASTADVASTAAAAMRGPTEQEVRMNTYLQQQLGTSRVRTQPRR